MIRAMRPRLSHYGTTSIKEKYNRDETWTKPLWQKAATTTSNAKAFNSWG